ncbi:hypothetical protein M3Y98_00576300 [Aphelenchoides besseyi]|nr:hypothetical protein M3Y98_00576300 [Aphelenchoides besseyi]KAI6193840.1 hypothetical protein M3Y96_01061500 [Aphelenchoides besseyi]
MFSSTQHFNFFVALCLALTLVVNCMPLATEDEDEEMARRQIMNALYRLNEQNNYRLFRASRSNGKPTFIRFGKRSAPSYQHEDDVLNAQLYNF